MMLSLLSPITPPILDRGESILPVCTLRSFHLKHLRRLNDNTTNAQVSPSIVAIIVILTIIFFLSAFLHLLIRWLARNPRRNPNTIVTLTALQGQLQQLFHLHDSGIEQAFIDALPVFVYKAVTGLKEGADCAVCLCEFQSDDRLRLLPRCSHAFHMDCIDTWLLSHSTCPLCRRGLQPDGVNLPPSGQGLLLDSSRSSVAGSSGTPHEQGTLVEEASAIESRRHSQRSELALDGNGNLLMELGGLNETHEGQISAHGSGRVVSVQLGRCRIIEDNSPGISASRRSYSKGSYEYVVDPSNLEVVIAPTPFRPRTTASRQLVPGHRATLSDCPLEGIQSDPIITHFGENSSARASTSFRKKDGEEWEPVERTDVSSELVMNSWVTIDLDSTTTSFRAEAAESTESTSMGEKRPFPKQAFLSCQRVLPTDDEGEPSKRAVSFRLPTTNARLKVSASRRSLSETEVTAGWDEEACSFWEAGWASRADQQSNSSSDVGRTVPSIAKRTMDWLVGRQKRIVHASNTVGAAPV